MLRALKINFGLLVSALSLATLATLGGCGGGSADKAAANQKVYNYVNIDEPKHLDPAYSYDVYEGIASGLLFDCLINFGSGSDVVAGLAERWDTSDDRTSYTFHLRKNAKFSNGLPITSDDVRYSFTRLLLPETNSDRKWVLQEVVGYDEITSGTTKELAGLETPDPHTVVLRLKKSAPAFFTKLAIANAGIIPKGSVDTDAQKREFDRKPISSGPWILADWQHDQRLVFKPNQHYWGEKPKLDQFIYNVQVDDSVQRQQFQIGKIDQYSVGFTAWEQWNSDPERKKLLVELPELNTYFVAFNHEKPKVQDKRVRQAISMAVDKQTIFDKIQKGRGTIAKGYVPYGVEGYRPDLKGWPRDIEKAKALIAEAGVKDLKLELWIRAEAQNDETAAIIKQSLEEIGVGVDIIRRDLASLREGIYNGSPDMYLYSWWLDYPDLENALEPTLHSRNIPRKGNGAHFHNAAFEAVLAQADVEADPAKRIALYQQAEDIAIDECAWVPLYHRKTYVAIQPWIKGYEPSLMINAGKFNTVDVDLQAKR